MYWFLLGVWKSFKGNERTDVVGQIIFLEFDIFAAM